VVEDKKMRLMIFHGRPCLVISEDVDGNELKRPAYLDKNKVQVILKNIDTLERFVNTEGCVLRERCRKGGSDF
jgi:hypothetical protein